MERRQIKMVVTDLDGTLLNPEKEISRTAAEVINDLAKKNIKFTFITGRPPYAVERFAEKADVTAPIVACNGAVIIDGKTKEVFRRKTLELQPLESILFKAKEQRHTVLVLAGETEYTLGETEWTRKRREQGREVPVARLETLLSSHEICKVNIMAENNQQAFGELLPEIRKFQSDYSMSVYGDAGCEIVAKGVNKEKGLMELCRLCGISPEEVMAVGDNENDIEMIRAAGIGAAVGNAVESVKASADYICRNCFTDGVIEAIFKFT